MERIGELDLFDRKILYELDRNSKMSISKLSKKLRRSKPFILYRIKNLEKKIITGYYAIIDMSKLGYFTFRVYFKFQQMTKIEEERFVEKVKKDIPQVWTITSMHGKWDYALFLGVKDITEFHELWNKIMLNYKNKVKSYNVSIYAPIYNFNRKFFIDSKEMPLERVYGEGKLEKIDKIDEQLLKIYASNVRTPLIEIAEKLKISPDTVHRRIKNLEKSKIIAGYKLGLNFSELNLVPYRIDFQLSSIKKNKELFDYCKQNKYIYQINKTIGGADFEIEAIVKDLNHLLELIDEIKSKFKEAINEVEYFGFTTFHILKYIPD